MTARSWPRYPEGDTVVKSADEPSPAGTRRVALADVILADGQVSDRAGSFRVPLAEFLFLPIFVAALRSFDPIGAGEGRAQIGRLVVRRASCLAPAAELPVTPGDLAAWARDRGLPRRVFARSPLERKPRYVDFESPSLCRTLARFLTPARERDRARPSRSRRCCPARTSAGSRATPATTRASCASSRSTAARVSASVARCGAGSVSSRSRSSL